MNQTSCHVHHRNSTELVFVSISRCFLVGELYKSDKEIQIDNSFHWLIFTVYFNVTIKLHKLSWRLSLFNLQQRCTKTSCPTDVRGFCTAQCNNVNHDSSQ